MTGVMSSLHRPHLRRPRAHSDARVRNLHALLDRALEAGVTVGEVESELATLLRWATQRSANAGTAGPPRAPSHRLP